MAAGVGVSPEQVGRGIVTTWLSVSACLPGSPRSGLYDGASQGDLAFRPNTRQVQVGPSAKINTRTTRTNPTSETIEARRPGQTPKR
jgi:hypothetical protein